MVQRSKELVNLPQQSTEDVRRYGREADEVLAALGTELEFRAQELRGRVAALLKYARAKGAGDGKDITMRSVRVALGYVEAAVAIRVARHGVRIVYSRLEKHCGAELRGLRDIKYGKGHGGSGQIEKLEV